MTPQAITWPSVKVGVQTFILRLSYAANYQLTRWGRSIADATAVELAAAMAGEFDGEGKWHSAAFLRPIDFADLMEPEDEGPVIAAVTEAIKKAFPVSENEAPQTPGQSEALATPSNVS